MHGVWRSSPMAVTFCLWVALPQRKRCRLRPSNLTRSRASSPKLIDFFSAKTPYEFWLTCVILAAGLIFAYLAIGALRLPVVEDGADTVGLLGGEFAAKQPRANLVEKNVRLMFVTSVPPLGYQP